MLIVSIVAVVAVGLRPLPAPFTYTGPPALFGFVLISFLLMRQHDRRLCEHCAHAIPLNPAETAMKLRRRFWMAHTGTDPRFLIPYLVVLIGSNFATSDIGRAGWALMQLSLIYLVLAQSTHRQLQPWCPQCSEGGGGQHVDDAPPVLPNDDRQLV
ncbi:hypothetical protein [uncultured Jatrophihabitans sp.]|uniref:hypothetical protein n=1 Tax=uncultured Jatrophihabitans sp. TaxID=1610747 RepID=UPI0035CB1E5E